MLSLTSKLHVVANVKNLLRLLAVSDINKICNTQFLLKTVMVIMTCNGLVLNFDSLKHFKLF